VDKLARALGVSDDTFGATFRILSSASCFYARTAALFPSSCWFIRKHRPEIVQKQRGPSPQTRPLQVPRARSAPWTPITWSCAQEKCAPANASAISGLDPEETRALPQNRERSGSKKIIGLAQHCSSPKYVPPPSVPSTPPGNPAISEAPTAPSVATSSNAGCAQASIFVHSGELGAPSPVTKRFIMIRKGQAYGSAKVGVLHRFIVGMFGIEV
jgi:hypothetical protein